VWAKARGFPTRRMSQSWRRWEGASGKNQNGSNKPPERAMSHCAQRKKGVEGQRKRARREDTNRMIVPLLRVIFSRFVPYYAFHISCSSSATIASYVFCKKIIVPLMPVTWGVYIVVQGLVSPVAHSSVQ